MKIKNLLLTTVSLTLLAGCKGSDKPSEPEKKYLLSKSYSYFKQSRDDEWVNGERYEYKYNEFGKRTEEKTFVYLEDSDVITDIRTFEYDSKGNETKYEIKSYDIFSGELYYKKQSTYENYDSFGNYGKESEIYFDDAPYEEPTDTFVTLYQYDEKGKLLKITDVHDLNDLSSDCSYIDYIYDDNGNLIRKVYSALSGEEIIIGKKFEYSYYENGLTKEIKTFYYEEESYEESPTDRHYFEYDENGFMTLYAIYEDEVLSSSFECEFISDVSCKETIKATMPGIGFSVNSITEKTYLSHEGMINDEGIISETEYIYDLYVSNLPTSKTTSNYTYENGNIVESLTETIYFEEGTETESSYFAFKEVSEYIEF